MAKLIIGCGYVGHRVARYWQEQGEKVYVMTRSSLRAKELAAEGLLPIVADVTSPESLGELPPIDCLLYAVGYDRHSEKSMRQVYVEGLKNVLDSLSEQVSKLIYVSSTGVYGQSEGEAVDESSPCQPTREGGKICLAAENTLREHRLGKKSIILRLAGIYGPDRVPRQRDIVEGKPIASPAEGEMNLIHVDDAVRIIVHFAETLPPPELFNLADGHPVRRRDYYRYLAELLSAPEPQFVAADSDSSVSERAKSSKRVDSSKLHGVLNKPLLYRSYREGLAAIVGSSGETRNR